MFDSEQAKLESRQNCRNVAKIGTNVKNNSIQHVCLSGTSTQLQEKSHLCAMNWQYLPKYLIFFSSVKRRVIPDKLSTRSKQRYLIGSSLNAPYFVNDPLRLI